MSNKVFSKSSKGRFIKNSKVGLLFNSTMTSCYSDWSKRELSKYELLLKKHARSVTEKEKENILTHSKILRGDPVDGDRLSKS